MNQQGFGEIRDRAGKGGVFPSTTMPLPLAQNMALNNGIPITIGGVNNKTFTVAGAVTRPVPVWNGNDFFSLRETKAYSFSTAGADTVFLSSTGVTTATGVVVGVIYMYLGMDSDGTIDLLPSGTAPSFVEGPYDSGVWGHPGASKDMFWNYVGYTVATTTVAAFATITKRGFVYEYTTSTAVENAVAAATAMDLSAFCPKHEVEISGRLQAAVSAEATFSIGRTTVAAHAMVAATTTDAVPALIDNFAGLVPTVDASVYGLCSTTEAAEMRVTAVKDVV